MHVHEPRHCEITDLFIVSSPDGPDKEAIIAASAEYLRQFAAPVKIDDKAVCFHCGTVMDGFMAALGIGADYTWSLTHGEAYCSNCHWPARGMHYPKDAQGNELWSARNLFLAYHPDVVEGA